MKKINFIHYLLIKIRLKNIKIIIECNYFFSIYLICIKYLKFIIYINITLLFNINGLNKKYIFLI